MTLDDADFIVNGPAAEGPGWEQQQDCEEHQQFEAHLEDLIARINNHLISLEWALREMQSLQAAFAPEYMSIRHNDSQGGHTHEL